MAENPVTRARAFSWLRVSAGIIQIAVALAVLAFEPALTQAVPNLRATPLLALVVLLGASGLLTVIVGLGFCRRGLAGTHAVSQRASDLTTANMILLILSIVGVSATGLFAIYKTEADLPGTSLFGFIMMVAAGGGAIGILVGFLLGLPRRAPEVPGDTGTRPRGMQTSTQLEEISDWLSKLIVGVGLAQITQLPAALRGLADAYTTGKFSSGDAAVLMGVYFFAIGFLAGYLYTRLFITGALARADVEAAGISEMRTDDFTASLPQAKMVTDRLKGLTSAQALAVAKVMEPLLNTRSKRIQDIVRSVDPLGRRLQDGDAAKQVILMWQIGDDRNDATLKEWTDALDAVEKS